MNILKPNMVFWHGAKDKIEKFDRPSPNRPFYVTSNKDDAILHTKHNIEMKGEYYGVLYGLQIVDIAKVFDLRNKKCIKQLKLPMLLEKMLEASST